MRSVIRSTAVTSPKRFVTSRISTSGSAFAAGPGPDPGAPAPGARSRRSDQASGRRSTAVLGGGRSGAEHSPVASLQVARMVRARAGVVNAPFRANLARNNGIVGDPSATDCTYTSGAVCAPDLGGDDGHGPAARVADPRAPPGASSHPSRGRGQGRGHRELPVAGRARRDQPVDRHRPADRPRPRPVDRAALRRGAAERTGRPARGPAPGRLPGPPGRSTSS